MFSGRGRTLHYKPFDIIFNHANIYTTLIIKKRRRKKEGLIRNGKFGRKTRECKGSDNHLSVFSRCLRVRVRESMGDGGTQKLRECSRSAGSKETKK